MASCTLAWPPGRELGAMASWLRDSELSAWILHELRETKSTGTFTNVSVALCYFCKFKKSMVSYLRVDKLLKTRENLESNNLKNEKHWNSTEPMKTLLTFLRGWSVPYFWCYSRNTSYWNMFSFTCCSQKEPESI